MQGLRSHRTQTSCGVAWERHLSTLGCRRDATPPLIIPVIEDIGQMDAPGAGPSEHSQHSASPQMEWEPGPENDAEDMPIDIQHGHMLEDMPASPPATSPMPEDAISAFGLDDEASKLDLSDDDEVNFLNNDELTESEDEGDEEYDSLEVEEDPGIPDNLDDDDDPGSLNDQACPIDEADEESIVEEYYPDTGKVHRKTNSHFQNILNKILAGKRTLYYPFESEEELELAIWMHQSGLPISKMDEFFKLKYVSMMIAFLYCSDISFLGLCLATLVQNW